MAVLGGLGAVGNGEVFIHAAEMVDSDSIVQPEALIQAGDPPLVSGLLVVIPLIQGVAPDLTVCGEGIGRTAGDGSGLVVLIQLEQVRMGPHIGRIQRNINGNITDDLDALVIGIILQLQPLLEELELQILLEFNIKVQLLPVVIQGIAPVQTDILRPLGPADTAEEILQGHEQGIVLKPPVVFLQELLVIGILADVAALVSLVQQRIAILMELVIVNLLGI